jgi:N utilization substance protein B
MGPRRRSREIALQILYQLDITRAPADEAIRLYYENFDAPPPVRPFAELLVEGVSLYRSEIDQLLTSASAHWRLERMSIVDRNILRLALYEMVYCTDIPPKVSINEAVDLGKTFGSEESSAFINGVLDHILLDLRKKQAVAEASQPT